jgi:hypothetical protein
MALPSSGLIDFSDVRTETSQSAFTSYAFSGWASGYNSGTGNVGFSNVDYAPINLISSGSGYGELAIIRYSPTSYYSPPLSLFDWYSYNHTEYITTGVTASLYSHWGGNINCSTYTSMIPVDVGTSNTTLDLNISGSSITASSSDTGCWMIFYGKPWTKTGVGNTTVTGCGYAYLSTAATLIASGSIRDNVNRTITYNYTYDVNKGQYIYYVVVRNTTGCYCDPSQC